jgi:hypothetical protein
MYIIITMAICINQINLGNKLLTVFDKLSPYVSLNSATHRPLQ